MTAFTIERIGADRIEALHAANRLFATAFGDRESYTANPPSDDYLRGLLADPGFVALAALRDGVIVGALAGYELKKFEQERSEYYIYDLAVAEAHRRRGIATALIRQFTAIAKAGGGWVVFVQADHGDGPAIALYEKLGSREEVMHFDIAVD